MLPLAVLSFLMWTGPVPGAATVFEIHILVLPLQTVTLPCRAARDKPVIALDWSRPDMESELVFLFRDNHVDLELQHPSFKNRVELLDRDMKNGDVSLVLKNVTNTDSGSYECRVLHKTPLRRKKSILVSDPIIIIKLKVVHSGPIDEDKEDKIVYTVENWNLTFEEMEVQEYLTLVGLLVAMVILLMAVARCAAKCWFKPPSK